jgi:predicted Rossmann fold flavoprotein
MELEKSDFFDVAIIGAGPAGMMAAIKAAMAGAKVILIEKNYILGKKLLLTGNGRCNLTNAESDLKKLIKRYGSNGKFLWHAFHLFGPAEVIDFFSSLGVKIKIEENNRVFPIKDSAEEILTALNKCLKKYRVKIAMGKEVANLEMANREIKKIILNDSVILAKNYILSTGGKSYPTTGSTGDGYKWAALLGHHLEEPKPALAPIKIKEAWVKELQGVSLKDVELSIFQDQIKKDSRIGECLFTHFGLSGPMVLDMSKRVGELLKTGETKIILDLYPTLDFKNLDQRIQENFIKDHNKLFKNSLDNLLPHKFIPVIIKLSKINPEKKVNSINKEERYRLVNLFKNFEMTPFGLLGFNSAIVTSGGVMLEEIDNLTMKSKLVDNLFFAGEIINLDGPTGGFNLQLSWSTGSLAGESAAKK